MELTRTATVQRDLVSVVDYLSDFAHTEEWDSGTVSCTRIGVGPVQVGTRWRNVSEFRGKQTEIEYTLRRHEPRRLTFSGENRTVSTTDDLIFEPNGTGTRIHYRAEFTFHGLAKLGGPFVKGSLDRLADDTIAQLAEVLDRAG